VVHALLVPWSSSARFRHREPRQTTRRSRHRAARGRSPARPSDACTAPSSASMRGLEGQLALRRSASTSGAKNAAVRGQTSRRFGTHQGRADGHDPALWGPQASCTGATAKKTCSKQPGRGHGLSSANDAVNQAKALGHDLAERDHLRHGGVAPSGTRHERPACSPSSARGTPRLHARATSPASTAASARAAADQYALLGGQTGCAR